MDSLLELRFFSDPKKLRMVRERVQDVSEELGINKKIISDLVIAVNEACMNIMQHAYKGERGGEIVLELLHDGEKIEVVVSDFAEPVDLETIRPRELDDVKPGGLGTHFIREVMDECDYGHLDGGQGNVLTMKKKIN